MISNARIASQIHSVYPLATCDAANVTQILNAFGVRDQSSSEQLLPIVYRELRRLAAQRLTHEKPGS